MATMAHIFNRLWMRQDAESDAADRANARSGACRLRPLPNEDVYFFVKRIDNSRVIREADPAASRVCWRTIAVACAAAVIVIGILLPHAWGVIAGYQIQSLKAEEQRLKSEFSVVQAEEARLLRPERLEELARQQRFVEPTPDRVHYLPAQADGTVALNRSAGK